MLVPLCFIIVAASNFNDTYSNILVPTSKIISVNAGKKHSNIKIAGPQYETTYEIKETPEQISALIKKECK